MTTFPFRSIQCGWDPDLYTTGRMHAATFQVRGMAIAGGVCYGYAHAAESAATQALTDQLLAQLTLQVAAGFNGPAFIAGDFNQIVGTLREPSRWEAMGWKEVQTWADEMYIFS